MKEWEIQVNKKSIPEYLINDHGFINTLIERMGSFSKSDDPNEFLTRFKTTAWELVPYWRERNTEVALFRELWTHRGELKLHLQLWCFLGLK